MDNETWIIIAVVVLVALLLVGLLAWMAKQRKAKQREDDARRAQELRTEADQQASVIPEARLRAEEEKVEAERLRVEAEKQRLEAEKAAQRAEAAQTDAAHQEATFEDRIREADRLDPQARHDTADDTHAPTQGDGGQHRA